MFFFTFFLWNFKFFLIILWSHTNWNSILKLNFAYLTVNTYLAINAYSPRIPLNPFTKKYFLNHLAEFKLSEMKYKIYQYHLTPVITTWGTWIDAALHYVEYFIKYQKINEKLAEDDEQWINKLLDVTKDKSVVNELTFIL